MARPRSSLSALGKLLAGVRQPFYVLDDQRVIVYCNEAVCQWLDIPVERLVGTRCSYHSDPDVSADDLLAAGLCPPPETWLGQGGKGVIQRIRPTGDVESRQAEFIPLANADQSGYSVIVWARETSSEPPAPSAEPGASELHQLVWAFRARQAGRYRIDDLIGPGTAMARIRRQCEVAACSDIHMLIVGPVGSGRGRLARAIHYRRHRGGDRPSAYAATLVPLASDVLGAELLQSAVTALSHRSAERKLDLPGTILLTEIQHLTPEAQMELLGVLTLPDFGLRVIATCDRPVGELVQEGSVRQDLLDWLSTIVVELPALKQRTEDIPLLAQVAVERHNTTGEVQLSGFAPAAIDSLVAYAWPGNLDEFESVVDEACQRADGPLVGLADLPERLRLADDARRFPQVADESIELDEYLAGIEAELIRRAMARARNNKTKAAQLLGLSRPRLYRRMVQLGLEDA